MQSLFTNLKIKPKNWFIFITVCFYLFVLLCSVLYPLSFDEVRFYGLAYKGILEGIKTEMLTMAPRLLNLLTVAGLYWGAKYKIFFCLINPFIQVAITYLLFYFIKGRKLNINEQADILPFLLICLTCIFAVATPSITLFCIAGAANYSWTFCLCLLTLCLYRFTYKGNKFKNTWYVFLICFLLGFASGMSNENTGPMMFGIAFCFFLLCKYKKIKVPAYVYLSFLGIILGIVAMFGSGGSSYRLSVRFYSFWVEASITRKLFFYLPHFNDFLEALYYIPVFVFFGLVLTACDLKKKVLREKFILSAFFLFCGLLTAFALVAAPLVPTRAYYSAGMFCLISFFFFLDFFYEAYKIYALKYITLVFLVYCLIISPFVVLPYVNLYKNFKVREAQISLAKEQGKEVIYTDIIHITPAPTQNLTIEYLDLVKYLNKPFKEVLRRWYGIDVIVPNDMI